MRKLNFLIGTVSGLFGGLLLSNRKLRKDLQKVKDPTEAARMLGKELQRGGREVAKEAKAWLESEETQRGVKKLKRTMLRYWKDFTKEAKHVACDATEEAKHRAADAYGHAKEAVEKTLR